MKKIALLIFLLVLIGGSVYLIKNQVNKKTNVQQQAEQANVGITIPPDLIVCTAELVAINCEEAELKTVCGYDLTLYESGEKRNNVLQFKSACHYCKFYGLEEKDVGGTIIKGLGYENKPCSQGMYNN